MSICIRIPINVPTLCLTKKSNAVLHARQHQDAVLLCKEAQCLEGQCQAVHFIMVMARDSAIKRKEANASSFL